MDYIEHKLDLPWYLKHSSEEDPLVFPCILIPFGDLSERKNDEVWYFLPFLKLLHVNLQIAHKHSMVPASLSDWRTY